MNILAGKRIVLGVCGSIAAYKVVGLARSMTLAGAQVDVVMTDAAQRFVGPATFQAITGRPVYSTMWELPQEGHIGHVRLGVEADAVVIAPATANTLARLAMGMGDDLLTIVVLVTRAPVICVPAMNTHMYAAPATQENIATLRRRGIVVLEPEVGRMAEPMEGKGRLPEPEIIEGELRAVLGKRTGPLRGKRVVVTAGGTYEPIDPVRFLGNRASGQMGYALAAAARDRGAHVVLISGHATSPPPAAVETIMVETALQMRDATIQACAHTDMLLMNAAVADYRPAHVAEQKIKKEQLGETSDRFLLELVQNPDILGELAHRRDFFKVGFAAETHDILHHAQSKLTRKGLHVIVVNEAVASIGQPDIQLTVISESGEQWILPRQPKTEAADALLDLLVRLYLANNNSPAKHAKPEVLL